MAVLSWDAPGKHFFETGVDRGVLYTHNATSNKWEGEAWSGLTGVTETPSGAEDTTLWADNIKYLTLKSAEEFGATLTCYTAPDGWGNCDGTRTPTSGVVLGQQSRDKFRLSYRTKVGNDEKGNDYAYKLHIVYGCSATPSERAYSTVNDSPEAIEFSYEVSSVPVAFSDTNYANYAPVSLITIQSDKVNNSKLETLEAMLYGDSNNAAYCPDPDTVLDTIM